MTTRRFEIRGIRSWRNARGERNGDRHNGTNGATRGTMDRDLTAVLDRWDRLLSREQESQRSAADQKERFREDARQRLRVVIAPALERIGREVADRGHGWTVEERIDIQAQPAIACSFRPASANGKTRAASELCFRIQFPDRLAVTGAVATPSGLDDLPARSYAVTGLDDGLVRTEVTRLITAALEAG